MPTLGPDAQLAANAAKSKPDGQREAAVVTDVIATLGAAPYPCEFVSASGTVLATASIPGTVLAADTVSDPRAIVLNGFVTGFAFVAAGTPTAVRIKDKATPTPQNEITSLTGELGTISKAISSTTRGWRFRNVRFNAPSNLDNNTLTSLKAPGLALAVVSGTALRATITNTSTGATHHKLRRLSGPGGTVLEEYLVPVGATADAGFDLTGLTSGTAYTYRAVTTDGTGATAPESLASPERTATPTSVAYGPAAQSTYNLSDNGAAFVAHAPTAPVKTLTGPRGQAVSYHRLQAAGAPGPHPSCFLVCERDAANAYYAEAVINGYVNDLANAPTTMAYVTVRATMANPYNSAETKSCDREFRPGEMFNWRFNTKALGGGWRTPDPQVFPKPHPNAATRMIDYTGSLPEDFPGHQGMLNPYMPGVGGRIDIGIITQPDLYAIQHKTDAAILSCIRYSKAGGNWAAHYFYGPDYHPISKRANTGFNRPTSSHVKPSVKTTGQNDSWAMDGAHLPNLGAVAFAFTGSWMDFLQLAGFGCHAMLHTDGNHVVDYPQPRGVAWSLRTIAYLAKLGPQDQQVVIHANQTLESTRLGYESYVLDKYTPGITAGIVGMSDDGRGALCSYATTQPPEYISNTDRGTTGRYWGVYGWQGGYLYGVWQVIAYNLGFAKWDRLARFQSRVRTSQVLDPAVHAGDMFKYSSRMSGRSYEPGTFATNIHHEKNLDYFKTPRKFWDIQTRIMQSSSVGGQNNPLIFGRMQAWKRDPSVTGQPDYKGLHETDANPAYAGTRLTYNDLPIGSAEAREVKQAFYRHWRANTDTFDVSMMEGSLDDYDIYARGGLAQYTVECYAAAGSGDAEAIQLADKWLARAGWYNVHDQEFGGIWLYTKPHATLNHASLTAPVLTVGGSAAKTGAVTGTTLQVEIAQVGAGEVVVLYALGDNDGDRGQIVRVLTADAAGNIPAQSITWAAAAEIGPTFYMRVFAYRRGADKNAWSPFTQTFYRTK